VWIFTKHGFFSIVRAEPSADGTELVMVRARVRTDLERLAAHSNIELGPIRQWPDRDYPYRVVIARADWASVLVDLAMDIDYPNFKSIVAAIDGPSRAHLYGKVWSVMYGAEKKLARS
jgi:hypothetical protein